MHPPIGATRAIGEVPPWKLRIHKSGAYNNYHSSEGGTTAQFQPKLLTNEIFRFEVQLKVKTKHIAYN